MSCIYCDVASRKIEARVLVEDEKTLCFVDSTQDAPGHAIVIPKKHVTSIFECDEETWKAVCTTARYVAQLLNKEVETESVNIFHASGPHADQGIEHLALHILPRRQGDGLDHLLEQARKHENAQIRQKKSYT